MNTERSNVYASRLAGRRQGGGATSSLQRKYDLIPVGGRRIRKVFADRIGRQEIVRELHVTRLINAAGIPSPMIEPELVPVAGGRIGLDFQELPGITLADACRNAPRHLPVFASELAALHHRIHRHGPIAGVPDQTGKLRAGITESAKLTFAARKMLLRLLDTAADESPRSICHGDLSMQTAIVGDKQSWAIDWSDVTNGNPASDVARTVILIRYPSQLRNIAIRAYCGSFARSYLKTYRRGRHIDNEELRFWLVINAAARVSEILAPAVNAALVKFIERELNGLYHRRVIMKENGI